MGVLDGILQSGRTTGWEVAGSSGASLSVGTPELKFSITASYLRLPLKDSTTGLTVMFQGGGAGVSVGVDISIPFVNASGGPDAMPSFGSRILRGPSCPATVSLGTFKGRVLFVTGSVLSPALSHDFTLAFFLDDPSLATSILSAVGGAIPGVGQGIQASAMLADTKGVAVLYGLNLATTLGGFGASGVIYVILPTGVTDYGPG